MFRRILDNTDTTSLANKFRRKRFEYFREFIKDTPLPISILDVGGTEDFWKQMGLAGRSEYEITILNIDEPANVRRGNFIFVKGDARDLSEFGDKSYDVAFSNSVIEHIPSKNGRQKMANEIARTGKKYFVQTPNYYFPFEPHFLFPCFQFFPHALQIYMLMKLNMGWFKKCRSKQDAIELLRNNSLLKKSEFKGYFTNCRIIKEKFLLLNKSFIAAGS